MAILYTLPAATATTATHAYDQKNGSIQGQVIDSDTQKGVPGVTVQAFSIFRGQAGQATTDANGFYSISLKPGLYIVREKVPAGYKGITPADVMATVKSGKETTANFTIKKNRPLSRKIYVSNNLGNTISVIDTATNTVTDTIQAGHGPYFIAISPDHSRAYVDYCCGTNYTWIIDTKTNRPIANISLPANSISNGIAIKPDGTRYYIDNCKGNCVWVFDTATNRIIASIPVGAGPAGIAITPDGNRAYVTNSYDMTNKSNVSVINTAINRVIATIPVGVSPVGVTVSPDGKKAYVTNTMDKTVSVISTATNRVIATIPVGDNPLCVAVRPDGKKAYVSNTGSMINGTTVSVIDTATDQVETMITVGESPVSIAFTPDSATAYVTNANSNSVSVINTAINSVIATIPVGEFPWGIAVI